MTNALRSLPLSTALVRQDDAMRAFVVTGPDTAAVLEVPDPTPGPDDALVAVQQVGVCGTDVAFFTGAMPFLHDGRAWYPIRLGHEWMGTVVDVGSDVDRSWIGRRVTGDTMLGCRHCERCSSGRQHTCEERLEVGVRGGKDGALAELIAVPATSLFALPDAVDDMQGALVEPSGNAMRAVLTAELDAGDRVLVVGPGTIGLLTAMFARARGAEVHLLGRSTRTRAFAQSLGFDAVWTMDDLPALPFHAVINASHSADIPAMAVERVEPGGRVVYVGLSGEPGTVDTRELVYRDITAVGILSGSPGMQAVIDAFAAGAVDPRPLVAATVVLDQTAAILAGERPAGSGAGPTFHIDPRR